MSDASLDLREQIVRIDRIIEESHEFTAEQHKLLAEARKLDRDRWLAPVLAIIAAAGGVAGFASAVITLMRLSGRGL